MMVDEWDFFKQLLLESMRGVLKQYATDLYETYLLLIYLKGLNMDILS